MNCDCIKNIICLLEENGSVDVKCEATTTIIKNLDLFEAIQIPFSAARVKKDGEIMKTREPIKIVASCCPFCGKSIKPDKAVIPDKTNSSKEVV